MDEGKIKNEITELTKKLIRFESTKNNKKELDTVLGFCKKYLEEGEGNIFVKVFERNEKKSLVATLKDTNRPKLFMIGHLDVVEGEDEMFKPRLEKSKLYGRGSFDMKGSDAVMMILIKRLSLLENPPDVGLILTTDEEIGGFDGVNYLFKEKGFSCDVAFVPDGGRDFNITTEEKGIVQLKISTKGKPAHSSRPWLGENAIDKLVKNYLKVRKEFPNPASNKEWITSLNIGKIKGGDTTNQVAGWAEAYLDIRHPADTNPDSVVAKIKKITSGLKVEVVEQGSVFFTSKNNPYVKKYKKTAEKVFKKKISFIKHPAASDARFLSEKKIPVILTDPRGGGAHARDEWVDVEGLLNLFFTLKDFLRN